MKVQVQDPPSAEPTELETSLGSTRQDFSIDKSIKRILVPLDPSPYSLSAIRTACKIASAHGAEIFGIAVLDSEEIEASIVPAIGPYYAQMFAAVDKRISHAKKALKTCEKRFVELCEEHQVDYKLSSTEGIPVDKIMESSMFYDLLIVGLETHFHFETDTEKPGSLARLLDRSITPVLAVTDKGCVEFERALVVFDGSLSSARAMHDFAKLAAPFNMEVTVIIAQKKKSEANFLLSKASEFLSSHGIGKVTTKRAAGPIDEAVDEQRMKAFDMIVCGIYSRKTVKDFFVGSFTRTLIGRKTTPLFLSH